jgi:predicted amidohydrolase
MHNVHAHLVQLDITWENRHLNFQAVRGLLAHAPINPHDLVVLPELFDTGFSLNVAATHDHDSSTLQFIQSLATDLKVYAMGGRTVLPDGATHAHNRMSIIAPSGVQVAEYSKIHPFTFGREPEAFVGGDTVVTFDWSDEAGNVLRVNPAICYDLRFPELFRLGLKQGAEVIALGANWPRTRQEHWRTLLIARAIENQAFVLGTNRTGDDPYLSYIGGSIAIDPKGRILGELGSEVGVLSVEIDPQVVRTWRHDFPAWRDLRLMRD